MSEPDPNRVTCPGCSKSYRWDVKLVGRTVECRKCSVRFAVPDTPGTPGQRLEPAITDDGTYELDLDEDTRHPDAPEPLAVPANDGKCPACNNSIKEGAVICLNCGFNLRQGKRMETAVVADAPDDAAPPSRAAAPTSVAAVAHASTSQRVASNEALRDDNAASLARQHQFTEVFLPVILVGVGLLLTLLSAFVLAPANPNYADAYTGQSLDRIQVAIIVCVEFGIKAIIIAFPLMIAGIFFMAAVYGSSFGNFFTAILKLGGMAFSIIALNEAVVHVLDILTGGFGFIGFLIRFAVVVPAFAIECKLLFDMEEHETWTLFAILIVGPIVIGMLVVIFFAGYIY